MNREEAIKILEYTLYCVDEETLKGANEAEAIPMAIEALKREDHDGCDGCRYEANYELSFPCAECKQNYVDKYVPMPEHDREWIIGCIKHDGFVKTDRRDKANQIILDALSADRPRGEWIKATESVWECSLCKGIMFMESGYCPHCGAEMRSE